MASDLFTIYAQLSDIQDQMDRLSSDGKLAREDVAVIKAATTIVHGGTEMLPVLQTLQNAVADRIEAQEAACSSKNQLPIRRKVSP